MSRAILVAIVVAGLMTVSVGCQSIGSGADERVTHVVVCWLKNPGNAGERQAMIDRTKTLSAIPGIRRIVVGTSLPSDRPQVDASFDVALAMEFDNVESLRAYNEHPLHKKAVEEVLKPLAARVVIYDFVNR